MQSLENSPLKGGLTPLLQPPDSDKTSLISKVMQCMRRIFASFFSSETIPPPPQGLEMKGIEATTTIKTENPTIDLGSDHSIIYNTQTNKYTYIAPALEVKNLVISGGGAKGVILPGVIKAFEKHITKTGLSFRQQIENVGGSSVGAITASLFAAGISADDLTHATQNTNFKKLLGKGVGPVMKSGKPLIDFIRENLQKSIKGNLTTLFSEKDLSKIDKSNIIEKLQQTGKSEEEINTLADKILKVITEVDKPKDEFCLTFSMLQSLHEMDPKTFKSLTITATCRETGQTCYFDATNTPNLDISVACRASAAIPIVITPLKIKAEHLKPGYAEGFPDNHILSFCDGGYLDNVPISAMQNKQGDTPLNKGEDGQNLQTLALVFDEKTRTNGEQSPFLNAHNKKHTLYNSEDLADRFIRDIFTRNFGRINTKERNTVAKERGLEEVREKYTQRNIPLNIDLKTRDFEKAQSGAKTYIENGYKQGKEYLELHEGELVAQSFDSLDELLTHVPEKIKEKASSKIEELKQKTQNPPASQSL